MPSQLSEATRGVLESLKKDKEKKNLSFYCFQGIFPPRFQELYLEKGINTKIKDTSNERVLPFERSKPLTPVLNILKNILNYFKSN